MTDEKTPPAWASEAEEKLEKVPGFVRGMAKKMIESYASEAGATEITVELMDKARAKMGM